MRVIWIKCPATGRKAATGIRSLAGFWDQAKDIRCPACGMRHVWLTSDPWLADAEPLRKAS
jgi:hypothetical protein